jgi:hypothetical protein
MATSTISASSAPAAAAAAAASPSSAAPAKDPSCYLMTILIRRTKPCGSKLQLGQKEEWWLARTLSRAHYYYRKNDETAIDKAKKRIANKAKEWGDLKVRVCIVSYPCENTRTAAHTNLSFISKGQADRYTLLVNEERATFTKAATYEESLELDDKAVQEESSSEDEEEEEGDLAGEEAVYEPVTINQAALEGEQQAISNDEQQSDADEEEEEEKEQQHHQQLKRLQDAKAQAKKEQQQYCGEMDLYADEDNNLRNCNGKVLKFGCLSPAMAMVRLLGEDALLEALHQRAKKRKQTAAVASSEKPKAAKKAKK